MNTRIYRKANFDIDPVFTERWSSRAFSTKAVEEEKLNSIFEAARWAPSALNGQPWRFIVAKTEDDRKKYRSFISERNLEWCNRAPVFVTIVSKMTRNEAGDPNRSHAFDTGAAWGYLALEATRQGLITHAIGGFDREKAREILHIPKEYDVQIVVAIGYHDPNAELSERNKEREIPSSRNPIEDFIFEGKFE